MIVGYADSESGAGEDSIAARLGPEGKVAWEHRLEAAGDDRLYDVALVGNGGFMAAGQLADPSGTFTRMYVTRISPNGSQEFAKTYGNTSGEDYRTGRAITRTTDGNYVIAGASNHLYNRYTSNFTYLAKVGPDGSLLWDRYCDLGLPGTFGADVVETGDGELAVVGTAWLPAGSGSYTTGTSDYTINYDALLVKRDKDGRIEWARTYDGVYRDGNSKNDGNALRETIDGGFLLKLRAEKLTPTIIATPIPSGTGFPVTTAPSGQSSSGGLCGGMAILPLLLIGSAGVAAARLHKDRVRQ